MRELKLGVVACLHGDLSVAKKISSKFKKLNVDAIILNGDVPSDENQYKNLVKILKIFTKTKKIIFIQPGSHEHYYEYTKAIKKFKNKIIDCFKVRKYNLNGYNLVFLPGSDSITSGAGFKLLRDQKQLVRWYKYKNKYPKFFHGRIEATFISNLAKYANIGLLICHIPLKFNKKESIDVAKFGVAYKNFYLPKAPEGESEIINPNEHVFTLKETIKLKKLGYPIIIKEKNVGNEYLKKAIKKLKIKKFVCGHIHESGGKANNLKGNKIKENTWSEELFYNVAAAKEGRAGLIILKDKLAKYKNIKVKL